MRKVLYGVCGIGNGHLYRQIPIIEALMGEGCRMVLFGYGASHRYFESRFRGVSGVLVQEVAVPFYPGGPDGLDFGAMSGIPGNSRDFVGINSKAMEAAWRFMGRPDAVITDYEPISAQYAYATGAMLVTIDQQSKYLVGGFPALDGHTPADEVARLGMFFPKADRRIACSFFRVSGPNPMGVQVVPPIMREAVVRMRRSAANGFGGPAHRWQHVGTNEAAPAEAGREEAVPGRWSDSPVLCRLLEHGLLPGGGTVRGEVRGTLDMSGAGAVRKHDEEAGPLLIYLTAQRPLQQSLEEVIDVCCQSRLPCDIYAPPAETLPRRVKQNPGVRWHHHGDASFDDTLLRCRAVVSTAGHTLLSEAMYLGKPVYAMPLDLYEQQMNAHVIASNGLGVSAPALSASGLLDFANRLSQYRLAISRSAVLLRDGRPTDRASATSTSTPSPQ